MKFETLHDDPDNEFSEMMKTKMGEFNWANWEVKERLPLGVQLKDEYGMVIGGVAARTFGVWLQLDNFWIGKSLRGLGYGSKILLQLEESARERGCLKSFVDTLNFQAKPFYEKHGYKVQWIQENYPRDGCKYFMIKEL